MFWRRKPKKPNKPANSIIQKLREESRSNEEFEMMISRLSLEELIWIKLEQSARIMANNKLYSFPLWFVFPLICKEALLNFAVYSTSSYIEASRFLGLTEERFLKERKKFGIKKPT